LTGRTVEDWIRTLDVASWRAPSAPWPGDENYRIAVLDEEIVVLYFVEVNEPDHVDLVWIGAARDAGHLWSWGHVREPLVLSARLQRRYK
jgi:hypothetical protein